MHKQLSVHETFNTDNGLAPDKRGNRPCEFKFPVSRLHVQAGADVCFWI
jgi:hypothetical protein